MGLPGLVVQDRGVLDYSGVDTIIIYLCWVMSSLLSSSVQILLGYTTSDLSFFEKKSGSIYRGT